MDGHELEPETQDLALGIIKRALEDFGHPSVVTFMQREEHQLALVCTTCGAATVIDMLTHAISIDSLTSKACTRMN
jgi:hypothetical protein